jgi:hypothetical protein
MFGLFKKNKGNEKAINAVIPEVSVMGINTAKNEVTQSIFELSGDEVESAFIVGEAYYDHRSKSTDMQCIRVVIDGSTEQCELLAEKLSKRNLPLEISGVSTLESYEPSIRSTISEQSHNFLSGSGDLVEVTVFVKDIETDEHQAVLLHVGTNFALGDGAIRDVFEKAGYECSLYGLQVLDIISNVQGIAVEEFSEKMKDVGLPGSSAFAKAIVSNQNAISRGLIPLNDEQIQTFVEKANA